MNISFLYFQLHFLRYMIYTTIYSLTWILISFLFPRCRLILTNSLLVAPLQSCVGLAHRGRGGAALQYYPVVKTIFLRRTISLEDTKKSVVPVDIHKSTLNASSHIFLNILIETCKKTKKNLSNLVSIPHRHVTSLLCYSFAGLLQLPVYNAPPRSAKINAQ